jgi:predicted phage tail protein
MKLYALIQGAAFIVAAFWFIHTGDYTTGAIYSVGVSMLLVKVPEL